VKLFLCWRKGQIKLESVYMYS